MEPFFNWTLKVFHGIISANKEPFWVYHELWDVRQQTTVEATSPYYFTFILNQLCTSYPHAWEIHQTRIVARGLGSPLSFVTFVILQRKVFFFFKFKYSINEKIQLLIVNAFYISEWKVIFIFLSRDY